MSLLSPSDHEAAQFVDIDLRGARFLSADLSGATMRAVDLSGVVVRGADVAGMDIDAPWLLDGRSTFVVNGVDVAPLVSAELDRRFPGRSQRYATDPDGLRTAWSALEHAWTAAVDRVTTMPAGTVDVSVDGEWSFAQTLRHLVMATDSWLRRAVLGIEDPFHPIGQPDTSYARGGGDVAVFSAPDPRWEEVLEVRAGRVAMVRTFLAGVTADVLTEPRSSPWSPGHQETVRSCLHTILEEEWEHLRFARRDLDAIEAGRGGVLPPGPPGTALA